MTTYNRYDSQVIDGGPIGVGMLIQGSLWAVNDNSSWKIVTPGNNTYIIGEDPSAATITFNNVNLSGNENSLGYEFNGLVSKNVQMLQQGNYFSMRVSGTTAANGLIFVGQLTLGPRSALCMTANSTIENVSTGLGLSSTGYYYLQNINDTSPYVPNFLYGTPTPPMPYLTTNLATNPDGQLTMSLFAVTPWNSTPVNFITSLKVTYVLTS